MKINWNLLKSSNSRPIKNEDLDKILFDNLKWHFALEASNIGIWDYDADLNRVFLSKESLNIIGVKDTRFGSDPQDWNNLVHPDDKENYYQDFQDHLNGIKPLYENVSRVKHVDGSYRWILDKGKVIERTKDGKDKRVIGVHIDITNSKEKETTLSNSIDLITKQNNKLKNFAHIATHNLKEHAGNFESLLSFYDEASTLDEKEDLINHVKTVARSLKKTISNLSEIVTVDTSNKKIIEALNLKDYVDLAIQFSEIDITNTKAIIHNDIDKSVVLNFNRAYLESIIQNLLTNALKYKHPDRNPLVGFSVTETPESTILNVTDNGLGIDLEKYGKEFFGLYRTFHQNKNSEGVGLYLTKNQMEAFGGSIDVSSKVDIGTKFTLKFPKTKKPA